MMQFDFQKEPGRERKRFYAPDPKDALVSIITPFYNAGKYFEQTFCSVMNQTFPWFEWIIVDDGSPKAEDVALLHRLAATDPRVTVLTQENAGPSQARNTAIAHAHTDLIVPLDADDLFDPTYVECLYWSLKYNPDAAWSYSNSLGFQEQEYVWKFPFSAETMKTYNFLNYTAMIRKKDIMDIGGYKVEKQAYHEDWRFWLDMLSMSKKPVRVNSYLFWYRRLDSGRLSSVNKDKALTEACNRIIEEAAKTVDTGVQAKLYPLDGTWNPYYMSKYEPWERKAYGEHRNMRVLWMIPWMIMGGADKFNLDAIAGLKAQGVDNFIVSTKPSENEWRQKFEDYTDEIFALPDFLDPAHYLEFVTYYIQSREIDVIMLTNSYEGYYMLPWIRRHFPDVAVVDYVHMEEWYWRSGGYARISGAMAALTEKTYVCNSATKDVMVEHFGRTPDSVETVYIGVDEKKFDRNEVEAGILYQELNISSDRPVVLFICRLHPQKRPFLMLEIAKKVAARNPDVAFAVVGDGPQEAELREKAKSLGLENNVYFLGARKDVRPYYRDAKVTLVCSLKEGLSLTAYESCAMGVPVVSADVGGQKDLIDDAVGKLLPCMQSESDSLDGRVFPAEEIDAYTDAVMELLSNEQLWEEKSRNCRQKIEQGFTIDGMVQHLYREFERLTTDETLKQSRQAMAEALRLCGPLIAETYTMEMQMESIETYFANAPAPESMIAKVKRTLREKGFVALIKKTLRWIASRYKK